MSTVAGTGMLVSGAAAATGLKTVGVQLYTVRNVLPKKPLETLEALDKIGYREAEAAGAGLDQIWPSLKKTRLKPVSIHLDSGLFVPQKASELSAAIEDAKKRGFEYVGYPYFPPNQRTGLDAIRRLADTFNQAGEKCRAAGLKFFYHNHAFEFEPMESTTPYQVLLERTDKNLVGFELDIFWVSVAGHDPIEILKSHSGRFPLMHLKNKAAGVPVLYKESVARTAFKEVGNGVLDIPAILRASVQAGVKHYFVEQDATPGDPVESLRQSYEYLSKVKF